MSPYGSLLVWPALILLCARGGAFGLAGEKGRAPQAAGIALGLANMTRPQAPVRAVMLSIGLSVTLLSAISMVDGNINEQISGDLPNARRAFSCSISGRSKLMMCCAWLRASPRRA